jgi:UPF0755 protein
LVSTTEDEEQHVDAATRGRRLGRFLGVFIALAVLAAAGYGGWYAYEGLFVPRDLGEQGHIFTIEPGQHLDEIARGLQEGGYVRSDFVLSLYARSRGLESSLQAGDYLLSGTMSGQEVLEKIVSGDAVFDEVQVTIPEGFTIAQMADRFEEVGLFDREAFLQAARMKPAYEEVAVLLHLPEDKLLEGYLFPDTYRIFADSTPETVVLRMARRLEERIRGTVLRDMRADEHTIHEILTLASIVQKESPLDDMAMIAGVFWNRIESGWLLESDATVNYALGTSKLQPTFADTEVDHPYNTYRYRGLPPGPVGSPGLDAIEATVHPADHDFFFFLHKPTEETVLSRTFAEHLAAKRRYLD